MTDAIVPAEIFPPGEFIKDELEARGWLQEDLAAILDCTPRLVSERLMMVALGTDPARGSRTARTPNPRRFRRPPRTRGNPPARAFGGSER